MGKKMEICNSSTKKLAEFVAGGDTKIYHRKQLKLLNVR